VKQFSDLITHNLALKQTESNSEIHSDEITSLIENKFLTLLFRRISRKLKKQKFFEKEELFREIKYLLETYLNGKDKILNKE
jgi:hypothetical protein